MRVINLNKIKKGTLYGIIAILLAVCITKTVDLKDLGKDKDDILSTNASIESISSLSNKKIGWGIKRNDNHEQPDLGSKNKELMDKYNGICIGNNADPYVYLTFDMGYEAGYTEKILEVLKRNDVKAAFFITAHYLNTQPDLVKRMIDEGHIVGNHSSYLLMDMHKS